MSAQTKPTMTERLKSLWDSYGIEVLKFGTVGGAAFIVNSVTVWVLMMTIMSESHTKAKVVASIVATIFSWLMNRLWTFRDSRSENWKREAVEFGLVNLLGILVEAGCVAFSTYVLNLRTPRGVLHLRYDYRYHPGYHSSLLPLPLLGLRFAPPEG